MTLDNFFARSPKLVWEEEQARLKAAEEQKRLDELRKALAAKRQGKKTDEKVTPPPHVPPAPMVGAGFSIEVLPDCYRLNGVLLRDGVRTIDLKNELLLNGESKKQDDWVLFKKNAGQNDFVPADAPTYHSVCAALYDNRDNAQYHDVIEQARQFLAAQFSAHWLMTLSRANYSPQSAQSIGQRVKNAIKRKIQTTLDEVIHDYGSAKPAVAPVALVGSQDYLSKIPDASTYCEAVVGDKDATHVTAVYKWITGKDAYAWRRTSSPDQNIDARAVVLGVKSNDDAFYLSAFGSLDYGWPALGVRSAQKNSTGNGGQ